MLKHSMARYDQGQEREYFETFHKYGEKLKDGIVV